MITEPPQPLTSRHRLWFALVVLLFAIVYAASLTFVYVEGDDASSIAFHAMGRQPSIQPPYSPYQGMMDLALGLLPAQEPFLRVTAMAVTSLATVLFVLLVLDLVLDWFRDVRTDRKWILPLVLLGASPELFYQGLFYNPNMVAMVLLLTAHKLLRMAPQVNGLPDLGSLRGRLFVALSLLFFGFGAACRWDMTAYGAVIVADLVLRRDRHPDASRHQTFRGRLVFALGWGLGAAVAVLMALWISGYSPATLAEKVIWGYGMATGQSRFSRHFDLRTLLSVWSLLSPAFLLMSGAGLVVLARRRDPLALIAVLSILLMLPWATLGIPKYLLAGFPGLVACMATGFFALWAYGQRQDRRMLRFGIRATLIALLIGPWLLGLRVLDPERSWGPGFELRGFDRPIAIGQLTDNGTEARDAWPVFGAGLALPTSEGPRPIGGHAAVLTGSWRSLVAELDAERSTAITTALEMQTPLLQDQGEGFATSHLLRLGFSTQDPTEHLRNDRSARVIARRFTHSGGDRLLVLRCRDRSALTAGGDDFQKLLEAAGRKVVIYGYGSTLRQLFELAPGALRSIGKTSAVLDLELLSRAHTRQLES